MTLAWDASPSTGIVEYRLYLGTTSRNYTSMIPVGNATTQTVSNLTAGVTYYFAVTAYNTSRLESDYSSEITYTVPSPSPPGTGLTFAADSGTFTAPFVASNGTLRQSVTTGLSTGGRIVYSFNLAHAGKYLVSALVRAPNDGQNSFYVNIDAEPTDPLMIWDIPICTAMTSYTISWRGNGNGDPATSQYVPKVFSLSAGAHQLIIRGREANTTLGMITISAAPPKLKIRLVADTTGAGSQVVPPPPPQVVLEASGQPGQALNVLCSPDLKTWIRIGTITLDADGAGKFTDPAGSSQPKRFYRLQDVASAPLTLQLQTGPGKAVVLSGTGPSGQTYNVLSSQDLRVWTVVGHVTIQPDGSFKFTDPAGNSRRRCFYRLGG